MWVAVYDRVNEVHYELCARLLNKIKTCGKFNTKMHFRFRSFCFCFTSFALELAEHFERHCDNRIGLDCTHLNNIICLLYYK